MSDIQTERNDILAAFAKQSLGGEPEVNFDGVATGAAPEVVEPISEPAPDPVSTAQTDAGKEKVEAPKEPVAEDLKSVDDWDSTTPEVSNKEKVTVPDDVLIELGKALGAADVKSKEDLIKAVTSIKEAAEKAQLDKSKIRPELIKAIELDAKGGDFYEYLKVTSVDYSKADPVQLYEDYVIDQLTAPDGTVDEDQVNDYLDNMKDAQKRLNGIELQKRLVYEQQRRVAEIEQEATRKREKADAELKSALSGLQEIDGFKVDDRHRRDAFEWVASGKMMRDLFYDAEGNLDPMKIAKNAFRNLYFEKLDAYQKNKIRNSTKREIIADITNQQITTPSIPANPATVKGNPLNDYIKQLEYNLGNR